MKRNDLINEALRRDDSTGRIIATFASSRIPDEYMAFARRVRREPALIEGHAICLAALINTIARDPKVATAIVNRTKELI